MVAARGCWLPRIRIEVGAHQALERRTLERRTLASLALARTIGVGRTCFGDRPCTNASRRSRTNQRQTARLISSGACLISYLSAGQLDFLEALGAELAGGRGALGGGVGGGLGRADVGGVGEELEERHGEQGTGAWVCDGKRPRDGFLCRRSSGDACHIFAEPGFFPDMFDGSA